MEEPSLVTSGCAYAPDTRRKLNEWLTSFSRVKTEDPDIGVSAAPSTELIFLLRYGTWKPSEPMVSVLRDRILMECEYSISFVSSQRGRTLSLERHQESLLWILCDCARPARSGGTVTRSKHFHALRSDSTKSPLRGSTLGMFP